MQRRPLFKYPQGTRLSHRSRRPVGCLTLAAALLLCLQPGMATEPNPGAPSRDEQRVLASDAFLNSHPDLEYRLAGWTAYQAGDFDAAAAHFKHAARYADKLSQAMLAEMYWNGQGVPVDRPLAYAWADLAAERGYVQFLAVRERYWQALGADERAEAITRGQALLHEYGDAAAKPRMTSALYDARRDMAGGMIRRNSMIKLPGPDGGWISVSGGDFYASRFWQPKLYQQWHDRRYEARREKLWTTPPTGTVIVRPLEKVTEDGSPAPVEGSPESAPRKPAPTHRRNLPEPPG